MIKTNRLLKSLLATILAVGISVCAPMQSYAAPEKGIDVSRWNGAVNWAAVKASGVDFAFIRVGSTKKGLDPTFVNNIVGAQQAGIRTGVYIYSYATSVQGAIDEANLVLAWIENAHVNFPVAFDIEDNTQRGLAPGTVTAMCNAFCDVIASRGYHPIVYTYTNFFKNKMTPELRYDYWIAQFGNQCQVPGFAIWQYSETGSTPGIGGHVDQDYLVKDYYSLILPLGIATRGDAAYFYYDYRIQFGWIEYAGMRFHADEAGRLTFGWFQDESGLYYFAPDAHALVGPNQIGEDIYYFNEVGQNIGGWVVLADQKYYFDPSNANKMLKGWFNDETGRHYLHPIDGHMVTGFNAIDDGFYLFSAEGSMLFDWQEMAGQRYYFNPADGKMMTGWLGDIANRYYLSPLDGHMMTGVQIIDGAVYNLGTDGHMLLGWQTVDGLNYYFDPASGGAMYKGLIPAPDGIYGTSELDGHQLKNEVATIGGVNFVFDANGRMVVGQLCQVGPMLYLTDATGAIIATAPAA